MFSFFHPPARVRRGRPMVESSKGHVARHFLFWVPKNPATRLAVRARARLKIPFRGRVFFDLSSFVTAKPLDGSGNAQYKKCQVSRLLPVGTIGRPFLTPAGTWQNKNFHFSPCNQKQLQRARPCGLRCSGCGNNGFFTPGSFLLCEV